MNSESYKIAIVSDLHCLHKSVTTPGGISHLYSNSPEKPIARHPVYALLDLLNKQKDLYADMIICPGDIADKADDQGLITGWEYLKKIKKGLNAKYLLSTVGNHDVDSRNKNQYPGGSFELLKNLCSEYPVPGNENQIKYWSKYFIIFETEHAQVLIINSCHNHNSVENSSESIIPEGTIEEIGTELGKLEDKPYKFAFCHHHPVKHSNIDLKYKDGDVIDNGDKLIGLLNLHNFQILIHGHKHDARIKAENKLTVFAAGSFSSLQNIKELGADNCFHIVELFPNKPHGLIETWVYAPTRGWEQKGDREFPCHSGFGSSYSSADFAQSFHNLYEKIGENPLKYSKVLDKFPEVKFLIPDEQLQLNRHLKKYKLSFVPELPNKPMFLTLIDDE